MKWNGTDFGLESESLSWGLRITSISRTLPLLDLKSLKLLLETYQSTQSVSVLQALQNSANGLGVETLRQSDLFTIFPPAADEEEHGIEMHLPFLYQAAKEAGHGIPKIVPIVVGSTSTASEKKLGELLAPYLQEEENTLVVSTDFCHW